MCERIDEVDAERIHRVAQRIFGPKSGNKATVVCMGKEDVKDWRAELTKYGLGGGA